jgi:hypothetical protein
MTFTAMTKDRENNGRRNISPKNLEIGEHNLGN